VVAGGQRATHSPATVVGLAEDAVAFARRRPIRRVLVELVPPPMMQTPMGAVLAFGPLRLVVVVELETLVLGHAPVFGPVNQVASQSGGATEHCPAGVAEERAELVAGA